MVENVTSVIGYDVLCCLDPSDENGHQAGVVSVTDLGVENVIYQVAAVESVIFYHGVVMVIEISHEAVEVMVNVIVHQEEVLENGIDVFL